MLLSLIIKNILLIKHVEVQLSDGLCVISGETGAGKSILLNSLLFCLGQKTKIQKTSLLRPGEDVGEVCCVFDVSKSPSAQQFLAQNEIFPTEEGTIIIRRLINTEAKVKNIINGSLCTSAFLGELGGIIFEFHTQSQQSKLVNEALHDSFLIEYAALSGQLKKVNVAYQNLCQTMAKIEKQTKQMEDFKRDYDYNLQALKEIESLEIAPKEELLLTEKRTKIKQGEREFDALSESAKKLNNNTFRPLIAGAVRGLSITNRENLKQKLDEFLSLYDDIDFLFQKELDATNFNERELEQIDDRIHTIRDIARKHRISTAEIEDFTESLRQKVQAVSEGDKLIKQYKAQYKEHAEEYFAFAKTLSNERIKFTQILSAEITKQLTDLGFIEADFIVDIKTDEAEQNWTANGFDKIKFLAKTNKGMSHDSISKIASGGEISRFMLAFKTALSKTKQSGLIVFDEIDQGIGGQTALALADKLKELSEKSQILLITHQATIAAQSNLHLKIYKHNEGEITTTQLKVLTTAEKVREIARMLFGEETSAEAIKSAQKLLKIV